MILNLHVRLAVGGGIESTVRSWMVVAMQAVCTRSLCTGLPPPRPGAVVNLTAIPDTDQGSVTLQWNRPLANGDRVTGYDIRFKPVGANHYELRNVTSGCLTVTLRPEDGVTPLSMCNFDVAARINEVLGQWTGLIQYVGKLKKVHT